MNRLLKQVFKTTLITFLLASAVFAGLLWSGIIWRSPAFYTVAVQQDFAVPIMNMPAYDSLGHHPRPYIYQVKAGKGSVYVLGIEHTKDINDPQIDSIRKIWTAFGPDIAFAEGRLGFLFGGIQDPVERYGEGGETVRLAKNDKVPFYTWEPEKNAEIKLMIRKFSPKQVALFYSLRPYFSNFRYGKPANPNEKMQEYINSRTNYDGIRGQIGDVAAIDSFWKAEFPGAKDWRDTSDEYGWPQGWLSDIFDYSNQVRDIHMCSAIVETVRTGKKVLVTMGSSHAFRIEQTLKHALK